MTATLTLHLPALALLSITIPNIYTHTVAPPPITQTISFRLIVIVTMYLPVYISHCGTFYRRAQ